MLPRTWASPVLRRGSCPLCGEWVHEGPGAGSPASVLMPRLLQSPACPSVHLQLLQSSKTSGFCVLSRVAVLSVTFTDNLTPTPLWAQSTFWSTKTAPLSFVTAIVKGKQLTVFGEAQFDPGFLDPFLCGLRTEALEVHPFHHHICTRPHGNSISGCFLSITNPMGPRSALHF